VARYQLLDAFSDGIAVVVAVYGVLFLDWNSQGSPDNQPFHGVCCQNWRKTFSMLTHYRFENGSLA
jgi:hypothetical protein